VTSTDDYITVLRSCLDRLAGTQGEAIDAAAAACAGSIAGGGIAWVFGAGHSAIMGLEAYPRIGGVLGFVPIVELSLLYFSNVVGSGGLDQVIYLERVPGYADVLARSYDLRPGDSLIIFSGSGLEVLPLEMAAVARARGLTVVAVTALDYSRQAASRRGVPSILADSADIVIDSGIPLGDAAIELPGLAARVGPTSTVINAAAMNCISVATAGQLAGLGHPPDVFGSPHLTGDGYDAYAAALARYRALIARGQR
jgi:uncharacterized phosphosugar-binding protein